MSLPRPVPYLELSHRIFNDSRPENKNLAFLTILTFRCSWMAKLQNRSKHSLALPEENTNYQSIYFYKIYGHLFLHFLNSIQ